MFKASVEVGDRAGPGRTIAGTPRVILGGACAGRLQIDSGPYARPDCDAMTPSTTGIRLRPKYVREAISYPVRELWF
ncbi:MAG: hypothetical protein ACJ8EP_01180, partial [Sphingomicrobium sp.]